MNVKEAVRESWLKRWDTEEEKGRKRNFIEEKTTALESTPSKKPKQEVISLLSDSDDDDHDDISIKEIREVPQLIRSKFESTSSEKKKISNEQSKTRIAKWPFKPLHNEAYDNPKLSNSIGINDLLSSSYLEQTFLFSFQYSLPFILPAIPSPSIPITIVHQPGTIIDSARLRSTFNISLIEVQMPPFASHHPKLIINFYKDTEDYVKIFMISANMTQSEFSMNNQMCWESPKLYRRAQSQKPSQFKTHLFQWVESYKSAQLTQILLKKLDQFDFSPIIGDFIASSPGIPKKKFGHLSLYNSLKSLDLIPNRYENPTQILYQSSSIGAPFSVTKDGPGNIFTHLLAPMINGLKYPITNGPTSLLNFENFTNTKLYVVFPSVEDIRTSAFGYDSGGWSHYNPYTKNGQLQHSQIMKSRLYHPFSRQRQTNTSHSKFILVSHDNFKTLEWVLFTSANMSKSAWGNKPKLNGDINISNFETGILISRKHYDKDIKLIPVIIGENKLLQEDEIAIELPFKLPPQKYGSNDEPWCLTKEYNLQDVVGNTHV